VDLVDAGPGDNGLMTRGHALVKALNIFNSTENRIGIGGANEVSVRFESGHSPLVAPYIVTRHLRRASA